MQGTQGIPIPAARFKNHSAKPSLGDRHHLYPINQKLSEILGEAHRRKAYTQPKNQRNKQKIYTIILPPFMLNFKIF